MSFDPISAAISIGESIIKRVWPDPTMQAKEILKLKELAQKGDIAELNAHVQLISGQLDINKAEALSGNLFASSWRPFIGWICGFALAYSAILEPFLRFVVTMYGYEGDFPVIDTNITLQILMGMLGLAGLRTREKEKKLAS